MPKFEVCVVAKEYRWIQVEAEHPEDAKEKAWEEISFGLIGDTKADDSETDVYVEGLVEEQ